MNVIVTGASSGLGAALARELARRGHAVGLIARREPLLRQVADAIHAAGGTAAVHAADVTDAPAVARAIAALEATLGPTDAIVANAGATGPGRVGRGLDADAVNAVFDLNVKGVVNTVAPVLEGMLERGRGQIVATSSLAGWRGLVPGGAYSASKAAVTTLMESWRIELAPKGISVTTIHPGFVRTPILDGAPHPTPFLLEADDAARRMADGIERRRREINFPLPLVALMRAARALPGWLYEPLMRRLS